MKIASCLNKIKMLGILMVASIILWPNTPMSLFAQEAFMTTGAEISGANGSQSYSVGQVVYRTNTGTNGSVYEGVQQPYEIVLLTEIEEAKGINLSVTAYPNPATKYLSLKVKGFEPSSLYFQLYDINGKLLRNTKLTAAETQIDMGYYTPSTYVVKVFSGTSLIKEFKIIKSQ